MTGEHTNRAFHHRQSEMQTETALVQRNVVGDRKVCNREGCVNQPWAQLLWKQAGIVLKATAYFQFNS